MADQTLTVLAEDLEFLLCQAPRFGDLREPDRTRFARLAGAWANRPGPKMSEWQVREDFRVDRKIDSIKFLREIMTLSLKDAKDGIELGHWYLATADKCEAIAARARELGLEVTTREQTGPADLGTW